MAICDAGGGTGGGSVVLSAQSWQGYWGQRAPTEEVKRASFIQKLSKSLICTSLKPNHVFLLLLQDRGASKEQPKFEMQRGEFSGAVSAPVAWKGQEE